MFIVSSVIACVCQLAETCPKFTHTSSEYDYFISQPKRLVVKHMPSDDSCYTLRDMRFGGFNTFNRCNIFANNWYADMVQASQQRHAMKSELEEACNAAAEQKQKYKALGIKLVGTIEAATEEKQKREELEIKLADVVETAFQMGQHYDKLEVKLAETLESATEEKQKREELEFKLVDTLESVTEEKQKREALEDELANVNKTVGELKQERNALKKDRGDAEFLAVISTVRCERLEFQLKDEHKKVVNLTQQLDRLDNAVESVKSANAELVDNMKSKCHEELRQADQQRQALRDALEKAQDAAKKEYFERKMIENLLANAREAVVKQNQQWENRWEAMQRDHLAEIEHLRLDTQPKPVEVVQLMSPTSTPHDINGDEFTTEHFSNGATAESLI